MKNWNELTFTQKRHRLYKTIVCRTIFFWGVCGKERQQFYKHIDYSTSNIDDVRTALFNEYMESVKTVFVYDFGLKMSMLKGMLS